MSERFDVIVAGLGAMGSAAAHHLSRDGVRVLGLDRFTPPHALGSSHGQTRIIREAYFEHPLYVPLVQRAYVLWEELARETGTELFLQTGGLMIGRPEGVVYRGAKTSAELHRLSHEVLSAEEVRRRFPALRPEPGMAAILEPRAGILFPERCIAAHLAEAGRQGAVLHYDEPLLRWEPSGKDGVRVETTRGRYAAGQLILSAGGWLPTLLPHLARHLRIERQVLFWFQASQSPEVFRPERCPIHLWEFDDRHFFYGFPDLGQGIKVACHHDGEFTSPEQVRREVGVEETEAMRRLVRRFLPGADTPPTSATVCLYTNTPDEHFWIDRHPEFPQVIIASPCSGHGFKFSSAVGEVLRDMVQHRPPALDLSLFKTRWADA